MTEKNTKGQHTGWRSPTVRAQSLSNHLNPVGGQIQKHRNVHHKQSDLLIYAAICVEAAKKKGKHEIFR